MLEYVENEDGWDKIVKLAIEQDAVPRCEAIAQACNEHLEARGHPTHKEPDAKPGYMVSVEGDKPLERHDYRATVITATNEAMVDNSENNTLIYNMTAGADTK